MAIPLINSIGFSLRGWLKQRKMAALIHRSGTFDREYYLTHNPDVVAASVDPLVHYVSCGAKEGRNPNPWFDTLFYLKQNPDVAKTGINPLVHYLLYGIIEGRRASEYADASPDLRSKLRSFQENLSLNPLVRISRITKNRYEQCANLYYRFLGVPCSHDADYQKWLSRNFRSQKFLRNLKAAVANLHYQPTFSIIMPVFNPSERWLRAAIESVLEQVYPHWELCIADDASSAAWVKTILEAYAAQDSRIKVIFREQNGHIAQASNSALQLATGEFVALLDHDDVLASDALYEVVSLLNKHPEADLIYSDEDKIDSLGYLQDPFFKPDWCPDTLLSRMYTCHLGVYRKAIIDQIGGFRIGYEGAQDYDLVLRFTEKTNRIFHIPKVLYHWRIHADSTASSLSSKDYALQAAAQALADALKRRNEPGCVVATDGGHFVVRYQIRELERVSIIIPTKNLGEVLDRCLTSIFEKTTYPNFEVILIDNGTTEEKALSVIQSWQEQEPERLQCFPLDIPFNYPRLNNYAVQKATGRYLLFLNNDTEVINSDWIEAMVEQAQRPSIGAVGALLLYPDNTVQHAGVVAGIGGIAGHSHKCFPASSPGYFNQLRTVNNYSAVTAACLMCRRSVFEEVNGFDESLAIAFNDVDFCFKLISQGYRNVYLPHAVLYHYESKSRGYENTPEKIARFEREAALMKQRWKYLLDRDPCYSPNLSRIAENFSLRLEELSED